jgi:hypothetical protein
MAKSIKIQNVQDSTKELYEMCSDIIILQKELDQMLVAIAKNSKDYAAGKISKDLFRYNEGKMKKECARAIRQINSHVDKSSSMINKIGKEIESQRVVERKPRKKGISEIKKEMNAQSPDQKTEKAN